MDTDERAETMRGRHRHNYAQQSSLLHDNLPNPHRAEPVPMLSAASVSAACAGDFYSWELQLVDG